MAEIYFYLVFFRGVKIVARLFQCFQYDRTIQTELYLTRFVLRGVFRAKAVKLSG